MTSVMLSMRAEVVCDEGVWLNSLMLSMKGEGICDVTGVNIVMLSRIEQEGNTCIYNMPVMLMGS